MKRVFSVLYVVLGGVFLIYLAQPTIPFPAPPENAYQSVEPADSETPERRAYFTNFSREEVLAHYQKEYSLTVFGITLPSYMLSYPPEDAYGLIRDQTRSTHLREIVYPFRESLFVNEFVPQVAKDDIWYKGVHYKQKITVSRKQSSMPVRLVLGVVTLTVLYFLILEVCKTILPTLRSLTNFFKFFKK